MNKYKNLHNMKNFNFLSNLLQMVSAMSGMKAETINYDGQPAVNRRANMTSVLRHCKASGTRVAQERLQKSSARVAQGLRKSVRFAATILVLLWIGVGNAWGADYSKNESWNFSTSGNTNWSSTNCGSYCGGWGKNKDASPSVYKSNIQNFKDVDFSLYENVSLTIYVKAGTNGGTNSYTVKLLDKDGNAISGAAYSKTKTDGMGSGSNASSAKESSLTFTPTQAFAGYRIEFYPKSFITQTRYVLTYDDKGGASTPTHTLGYAVSPAASGTVDLSATTVAEGGTATATATPNSGYRFSSWAISGAGASLSSTSTNPTTVTMGTANATITANFVSKGCTDHGASSITSGVSSGDDYGPIHAYYRYSTSQILYTKSDLDLAAGKKGTIKSIYFEYSGTAAMAARTIKIYMANTDLSSLTTSNYVPYASFTQVYSGTFSCGSAGWYEITLDTPFDYNGIGNLVVMVDDNTNSYQDDKNFKYHSVSGCQIYKRQDSGDIDPASWTPEYAINYRPNTKFCIQEADMTPATVTLMDNGATITEASVGAGVTLPSRAGCAGYTFAGWTKSWATAQTTWTTTEPTIIPAGSYTPTANENLYPVYTKTEGGGTTTVTKVYSGANTADVQFSTGSNNSSNSLVNNTGYTAGNVNVKFAVTSGTNYSYYDGSVVRYYANNTITITPNSVTITKVQFVRSSTTSSNGGVISTTGLTASNSNTSTNTNEYTGSTTSAVTFTNDAQCRFSAINVTYTYSSSTTSYISVPNCCTPLGTVSATLSDVSGTTANFTWSAVTGAEKYQVKVEGSSSHNTWTDATSGVTVSGLTAGSSYTAYFRAIDTNGSHCSESEETSKAFTTPKLTVTPTTITGLNYPVGSGPSEAQSFSVSGVGLTGNVTITAPTNFEVSKTSATSGFASSVSLTPSSGTISATTIWVRLASGKAQGTYGPSNVTVSGGSATALNVSVTGVVSSACEDPTINTHPAAATYNLNATATALSVAATKNGTGPALAYQWYSNTANNNTTGSAIPSATSSTYTPPTTAAGTKYYYCVVSSGACETPTNTAAITVRTPSITVSKTSIAYGDQARGEGHTETFTVTGANLASEQGLSLAISGTNQAMFSVDKTSVAQTSAGAVATTTITVTYTPSSNGAHSATITVSSTGAESKTVALSGTGKWKVTWMKGGAEYTAGTPTTLVANSSKVTTLPTAPADDALGACANKFMGWSATNIGNTPQVSAPADLFTTAANSPAITANTTFYAVYATASGGTGTATFNPSTQAGLSNSDRTWTHTASGITLQLVGNASYTKRTDTHWQLGYTNGQATAHYAVITSPTTITRIDITLDENQYKVNSVTNGTLNTSGTSQTITGSFTTTTLYPYVASSGSKQAHMTNIVVTYSNATYSDYVTECCTDWTAPTLTYSIPSGWKAGDANVSATIGSGTTHGAVSFESSNTGVLTVNASGEIHAVGAGTATVTATWAGDATYCEKSRTSATITVSGNVTVTFDKNGGTGTMANQSIPYNTATALKANTFTAPTCKEFYGWADSQAKADAGTRDYTDGQSVTLTTGKTLYAVWKDKTYTVTKGTNTGAGTFTLSTSTITCGATLTITCAADGDHKGNPAVTATGTHGEITVVSTTSVTIANVQSAMTVNISYDEKENVTATWNVNNGSVAGGSTTTQKEGTTFTFPNVTSTDCGTFLGWTDYANRNYNSTSGKPSVFYAAGATITLNANTQFYAVYSKVGDDAVAGVLYQYNNDGTDLEDVTHGVNPSKSITGKNSAPWIGFELVGNYIIWDLGGVPTSFNAYLTTSTGGNSNPQSTMILEQGDKEDAVYTWDPTPIATSSCSSTSTDMSINVTNPASFEKRYLRLRMTEKKINVRMGAVTINGLIATINYTTNPGCVDWELKSIAVTTNPTKMTYQECETFDNAGMVVTATMQESGNPSNTTTKDVAGYTYTPTTGLCTPGTQTIDISYTEKGVTKSTSINVTVVARPHYTITFHDGPNTDTWTQTYYGESYNLDSKSGTLACGEYVFAGWSTSSTTYDDEAATITTWVSSSYTPTVNTHLYAVYTKGAAPAAFTANCAGGTFSIGTKNGGSTIISHAANVGSFNSYEYGVANSGYTVDNLGKFLFEKVGDNTYKISLEREDDYGDGIKRFYVAKDDYSAGSIEFLETYDADQCKWKVVAGTYGSWRIYSEFRNTYITKDYGIAGRGNDGATPRFRLVPTSNINGTDNYDVELEPVTTPIYQSNPNCLSTYTITFDTHGGAFVQGNYAYATATTSGLSGTTTSKFPSATMSGCTFVGWKEGNAQDEETDSNAEDDLSGKPYGLIEANANMSISSNKTYHAVYHYYDDDWEFDPIEGGTYHMYATISGVKHFCSGTPQNSAGTLSSTTDCGSVVDVVITPGTGANVGKYKININGVDVKPELNNTGLLKGEFWWNITEVSTNLYHITADGAESGRSLNYYSTSSAFTHYKDNSAGLNKDVSFGRCRQHHWTSTPSLTPLIILNSDNNITVTSTKDNSVKAISKLKVSATHYGTTTTINLSCDIAGVSFSPSSLTTGADGEMSEQEVTVIYTPTAYPTTVSGITDGSITAQDANVTPLATASRSIKVRNLPAKFVIAARVGDVWMALPAGYSTDKNSTALTTDKHDAVPVKVDNVENPTQATITMNTTGYGLQQLPTNLPTIGSNRWSANGQAAYFVSSVNSKCLYAGTSTNKGNIGDYATPANAPTTNPQHYEWVLQTTDLVTYQLLNSRIGDSYTDNILGYSQYYAKWGMYSTATSNRTIQDVRLLPITTELIELNIEVMEWNTNSMALRIPSMTNITSNQLNITYGEKTKNNVTLERIGAEGSDMYKAEGLTVETKTLADYPCELLVLTNTVETHGTMIRLPQMISSSPVNVTTIHNNFSPDDAADCGVCRTCDLVILKNGELVADEAKSTVKTVFSNLYVYPGGKLNINEKKSLGITKTFYLRGGYSFLSDKTAANYLMPEAYITGNFSGTKDAIYDFYIDNSYYYLFTLPYTVPLANVHDETGSDGFKVWVKYYDGAQRASGSQVSGWKYYDGTDFTAGVGYEIAAKPLVGGRPLAIVRFPLGNPALTSEGGGELEKEAVKVDNYGYDAYVEGTQTANNVGWNFVGNPFMSTWKNTSDWGYSYMQTGSMQENKPDDVHWDGSYKWKEENVRYVTILNLFEQEYSQKATSNCELPPFQPFFIQVKDHDAWFSMSKDNRIAKAPAQMQNIQRDNERLIELILNSNLSQDNTGLLIGEDFSADYEMGDDLVKMTGNNQLAIYTQTGGYDLAFNALSEELAAQRIPVGFTAPADGEYSISINDNSDLRDVESVILTDYETGLEIDLMAEDYIFDAVAQKNNDHRFTLNIRMRNWRDIGTDIDGQHAGGQLDEVRVLRSSTGLVLRNVPLDATVYVYDMTGKLIGTYLPEQTYGQQTDVGHRVELNGLPIGAYNIRVQTATDGKTLRGINN